jgi:hypothetical protein
MYHEWGELECIYDFGWEARKKSSLGRPKRRWVDNIKMDLRDRVGWYGLD